MLADGLADRGYDAVAVGSSEEAAARLATSRSTRWSPICACPASTGSALLAASRAATPDLPVIVMTAYGAIDSAIESIRRGASHYLTKPFKLDELALFLDRALDERGCGARRRRCAPSCGTGSPGRAIIGASAAMRARLRRRRADGATRRARAPPRRDRHRQGARRARPPRRERAGGGPVRHRQLRRAPRAAPRERALRPRQGRVHRRDRDATAASSPRPSGGTLFLDEIAEMSPRAPGEAPRRARAPACVRAVGASKERAVDVRVVAATHRDLDERVAAGAFREDLLLPARRRVRSSCRRCATGARTSRCSSSTSSARRARAPGSPAERIAPEAVARLVDYRWPGNVRELAHVVERMVLLGRVRRDRARRPAAVRRRAARAGHPCSAAASCRCASSSAATRRGRSSSSGPAHAHGRAARDRPQDAGQVAGRRFVGRCSVSARRLWPSFSGAP